MKFLVFFLALISVTFATRVFLERETELAPPEGWKWSDYAPKDQQISLSIALKQQNLDVLQQIFHEVSNPQHKNYKQYLTRDEIRDLVAPSQESIDTVTAWLLVNGIQNWEISGTNDILHFETTVEVAENMLGCKFYLFSHKRASRSAVSSYGPYSIPSHLSSHIDVVTGVTGFPALPSEAAHRFHKQKPAHHGSSHKKHTDSDRLENKNIGPQDLRTSYNIPSTTFGNGKTQQAVAEFQGQFYSPTDLTTFFNRYWPNAPASQSTVTKTIGTNLIGEPGVEAELDIQYIMGVAPGVPTWFWSNPGFNFWNDLLTWMSQIFSQSNPPQVHSVSYGDQAVVGQPSDSIKNRLNAEFMKAGVQGLSIIFASGDSGAGCYLCKEVNPSFPATSPYVTGVGATRYINGQSGTEEAVQAFGSGGGFSEFFTNATQFSYQTDVVKAYFDSGVAFPPQREFDSSGRGTPDVAAHGIGFTVVVNGNDDSVGGTSASAPTFAAVISLINDQLNAPLGFLNNFLYQNADALNDITQGNNKHSCCPGFQCTTGWDAVTGLGTPDFQKLLAAAKAAE